ERNWARQQMVRQLLRAGRESGDKSMPSTESMVHNVYRWERGMDAPSERYMLYYCKAFGISPDDFGPQPDKPPAGAAPAPAPAPTVPVLAAPGLTAVPQLPSVANGQLDALLAAVGVAYREREGERSRVGREVLMGAHEGSEQASFAEERGVG